MKSVRRLWKLLLKTCCSMQKTNRQHMLPVCLLMMLGPIPYQVSRCDLILQIYNFHNWFFFSAKKVREPCEVQVSLRPSACIWSSRWTFPSQNCQLELSHFVLQQYNICSIPLPHSNWYLVSTCTPSLGARIWFNNGESPNHQCGTLANRQR